MSHWYLSQPPASTLGQAADTAYERGDDVRWLKEGSVWVPQHDDPKKIIPSASYLFWYDAAAKTLGAAPDVATITDLFGSGDAPTQGSAAARPHFDATGAPLSLPELTFDGTDDALLDSSATDLGTDAVDFFALVKSEAWGANDHLIEMANAASTSRYRLYMNTGPDQWVFGHDEVAGSAGATTTVGANDANWHLVRCYLDTVGDLVGIQVDNGTPGTTADATTPASKVEIHFGQDSGGGNFCNFSLACAIGKRGGLIELGRRIALTRYFNRRYGQAFAEPSA